MQNTVKGNLNDMRHKLQDIQNNKTFLEKKIYEYEKKLSELKGNGSNNNTSSNNNESTINSVMNSSKQ